MRTAIVILVGVGLAALFIFGARQWKPNLNRLAAFAVLWAMFCSIDTYIGVAHAGYGLGDELLIHAVIFVVPVAIGWLLDRRLR